MMSKNTICLWYDGTALEAATFYAETFPDSAVGVCPAGIPVWLLRGPALGTALALISAVLYGRRPIR